MRQMNILKRIGAVCTALLLTVLCASCGADSRRTNMNDIVKEKLSYTALRSKGTLSPTDTEIAGKKLAQQNDWLALYYEESTAAVSVFDKRTGLWWHSNPDDPENPASRSQLSISTISSQGVVKQYTSYADSLSRGQVSFETGEGLTVSYTFGNPKPDLSSVPEKLTDERHKALMERAVVAGGDKTLLTRRYIQKDGIWIRKDNLTADQSKKLRKLFELIDYTAEELAEDNAAAGTSGTSLKDDSFMIPLTYLLEGDSLRVYISGEQIRYPTDSLITSLEVLEYFGALKENTEGWIFIPDGSGALVDTSARMGTTGSVSLPLYGRDDTLPQTGYSPLGEDCLLPVFGFSRTGGGMLAVIEDNEAIASIQVVKPGYVDSYATASTAFALNATQNVGLSSDSISKFYITAETRYAGDTALRYVFLEKEDATYSGMAGIYRDYLDLSGERTLQSAQESLPFFLETVGAIDTEVSTLGFVHDTLVPLTTYEDNITLIEQLQERGIEQVNLILTGWMNGGSDPGLPDKTELIRVLGGKKKFAALCEWAENSNVRLYPQVLLNTFSASEGLTVQNTYASRALDNKKSYRALYDVATGSALATGQRYLLSPTWQRSLGKQLCTSLKKAGLTGVNLGDIATTVYSDYGESSEALRQTARISAAELVAEYADALPDLMLTAPNDLTARYSHVYTDVPKSSASLSMAYCSVPFYQMVFHGYASYSFTAMNYDADFTRSLLKCAEYGSCPKFQFVAREDDRLTFVDDAAYYASYYKRWMDSAAEAYAFLNELLTPVQNARMINHVCISDGVYRTEYDNNCSIYVNFNDAPVTVDGVTISAQNAVRKGGDK